MADATLDTPIQITAVNLEVEEIVIRPGDQTLAVFLSYTDASGNPAAAPGLPRSIRVESSDEAPTLFNDVMLAWVQPNPRKKLLDALKTASKLSGITTT